MPTKVNETVGVKVRSPKGVESEVASQHAADSLCENHSFVDIEKGKVAIAAKKAEDAAAKEAA